MDAGTNVFRINMSHAKHTWAADLVKKVRCQAQQRNACIAVLFDLTGPSIRTGDLLEPFSLMEGEVVEFRKNGTDSTVEKSTTVNYDGLMADVAIGNTLVVDNGALLMRINVVEADRILCNVRTPGTMGSRRHINLPGVRLNLPALTKKDHEDLALAVECEADYIAGSFVRDAAHVRELRDAMKALEADALMLSGETSVGRYPERCVEALVRISTRIERSGGQGFGQGVLLRDERQKVARAAVNLADSLPDALLVVLTRRGVFANQVAMLRPSTSGFYAITPKESVCRKLALTRGVRPIKLAFSSGIEETIQRVTEQLLKQGLVSTGTPIVIVSDIVSDHFAANSILLHHA